MRQTLSTPYRKTTFFSPSTPQKHIALPPTGHRGASTRQPHTQVGHIFYSLDFIRKFFRSRRRVSAVGRKHIRWLVGVVK